jgi:hypothetical protein
MSKSSFSLWLLVFTLFILLLTVSFGTVAAIPLQEGLTGSWYQPTRSGEGFAVEVVVDDAGGGTVILYMYTYRNGLQLWLVGAANFTSGDTEISVRVQETYGTGFGDEFDAEDVVRADWGTITLSWDTCNLLSAHLDSDFSLIFHTETFKKSAYSVWIDVFAPP